METEATAAVRLEALVAAAVQCQATTLGTAVPAVAAEVAVRSAAVAADADNSRNKIKNGVLNVEDSHLGIFHSLYFTHLLVEIDSLYGLVDDAMSHG